MADTAKDYEAYFPVICKGDQIMHINTGDYVSVVPGRDYGVIHLYGKEYMLCTLYDVDYVVTPEYAKVHDTYEEERLSKQKITADLLVDAKKGSDLFAKQVVTPKKPFDIIDKTKYK